MKGNWNRNISVQCLLWLVGVFVFVSAPLHAANPGDEVIVIYNSRVPESKAIAEHYAERRHVPATQVFGFALNSDDDMTRAEYRDGLEKPLAKMLEDKKLWTIRSEMIPATTNRPGRVEWKVTQSKIRYAVLCYGIPYRIKEDPLLTERSTQDMRKELRRNEACVDNELAVLPAIEQHLPLYGPLPNPLYSATNSAVFYPSNGVLLVARLDGPTPAIATELVDKAMQAETNGLWGRAYVDLRNIDGDYKLGDEWLRGAADIFKRLGFETVIETNPTTFSVSFPMSQIAFYCGWYDNDVSGPFTRTNVEFMPGAFAYHLHSYSAARLHSTTLNWSGPLLAKGATITMGSVNEPFLGGTPDVGTFASRFIYYGMSFGEAAYASQTMLSWQTVVIGDPLYRPFRNPPQVLHEQLTASHSKLLEWSYLRLVNMNMAKGAPLMASAGYLEHLPLTKESAVLSEKLADIYHALGKPLSAVEIWRRALELEPSPEQRVRLRLALADALTAADHQQDAIEDLSKLLNETPDYPSKPDIYRKLSALAKKLGKADAAAQYDALAVASTPSPKQPN